MSRAGAAYILTARLGGKSIFRSMLKTMLGEQVKNKSDSVHPKIIKSPTGEYEIEGTFELSFLPPPPPWSYRKWCAGAIASYREHQNPSGIERKRP